MKSHTASTAVGLEAPLTTSQPTDQFRAVPQSVTRWADTVHAGHGALPRRRRSAEHIRASDGRPLIRPFVLHGERVAEAAMARRRARAGEHYRALEVLGRISVEQAHARAAADLKALTSSLPRATAPNDLSELAGAIKRLIRDRPDLAYTSDNPSEALWNHTHIRHTR